jgi:hypothetical protein
MRDLLSRFYALLDLDRFPCLEKPMEPKRPAKPKKPKKSETSRYDADFALYNKALKEYELELEEYRRASTNYNAWLDEHVRAYTESLKQKWEEKSVSFLS